jgi:hypothetical protein
VGVGLLVVYSAGFLVSNAYYGNLWLVDPSILQTRYAAAGVVWLVYAASSLLPCHYLLYFWRKRTPGESAEDQDDSPRIILEAAREWIAHRMLPVRIASWTLLSVTVLAFLLIGLSIFVLTPFLPLAILVALGASPADVWKPVWLFHIVLLVTTGLFKSVDMDRWASWEFRKNPHRIALLGASVVFHAVVFGRTLYPALPAGSGGGRPLIATIRTEPTAALPRWLPPTEVIDSARIIALSSDFLVALIRLPVTDSAGVLQKYCPVAIRSSDIKGIEVHSVQTTAGLDTMRGRWPWSHSDVDLVPCP